MNQRDLIMSLSDKELKKQLYYSQLLFVFISLLVSFFFFHSLTDWLGLFSFDISEILTYGMTAGLIVVAIDLILMSILPKSAFDDGGINEKLFRSRTIYEIFEISLVVAICEELLFRGAIQTSFGLIFASILFAIVHVRYLKKPVLFISVVTVSFFLGYLYYVTNNLLVPMFAHFLIDFLLGLIIRFRK